MLKSMGFHAVILMNYGKTQNIASFIDHTLIKKDASEEEIKKVCEEAIEYNFKSVCLYPKDIPLAAKLLKGKKPIPIAVVDFPLGQATPSQKAKETKDAIEKGAKEIDMVMDYNAIVKKDYKTAFEGIKAVVEASPYPVKVILETCELNTEEIIIACALSKAAGAQFVKTSTGLGKGGATLEDVSLMKRIVGPNMSVKASGGIKTKEDALKMIDAGADRIGSSASVKIVKS